MRLIDADKIGFTDFDLFIIAQEREDKWKYAYRALSEKISRAPIIDAVPVVRCKDCKYYAEEGMYCTNDIIVQFDHFYCYYGERRTE